MIDTMKMTVTTPTLTPRIVNAERNLFARNVSIAMKADSLMSSSRILIVIANCQLPLQSSALNPMQWHWNSYYSARSASIGSSFAARHAGHNPLKIPTTDETPTPHHR